MKSFCNPLNLSYKYQHYRSGKVLYAHREAADPTLVLFKGRYYLFASMSGGFWHSTDLLTWEYHENKNLEIYSYAPDVRQVGDYLYFSASKRFSKCPILRSREPLNDDFELVSAKLTFWDPNTFCDDDGKVYFYWGCSNKEPLWGVEMDPDTMIPKNKKVPLVSSHPNERGYERVPEEKGKKKTLIQKLIGGTFIEGAFVNKFQNKYYLQYACPATESNVYSDGVYVAYNPLGPYEPQQHNPFSSKPGGFITGAGHGSTIQDKYGNWWHASTMRISVNHKFERRVGLFPAGFDEDGVLFCNQNFADYPIVVPEGKFDPRDITPKWMLLSYQKQATASSSVQGHDPTLALNEDIRTCWCAAKNTPGEWYQLDLGDVYSVHAIQINFADFEVPKKVLNKKDYGGEAFLGLSRYIDTDQNLKTRYLLEGSTDGNKWFVMEDKRNADTDFPHDYLEYLDGIKVRYIKITAFELPYSQRFALSGLRVFGKGNGKKPEPAVAQAKRTGDMDAIISWEAVDGAQGYNIRYGIAPDKLYSSWLVYGQNSLELPMLCKGQSYYVCVDSFNENGITQGNVIKISAVVD